MYQETFKESLWRSTLRAQCSVKRKAATRKKDSIWDCIEWCALTKSGGLGIRAEKKCYLNSTSSLWRIPSKPIFLRPFAASPHAFPAFPQEHALCTKTRPSRWKSFPRVQLIFRNNRVTLSRFIRTRRSKKSGGQWGSRKDLQLQRLRGQRALTSQDKTKKNLRVCPNNLLGNGSQVRCHF